MKASSPMRDNWLLAANLMVVNAVQPLKAPSLIALTLLPMVSAFKAVSPRKANRPISVEFTLACVKALQRENTPSPIE